VELTQETLQSLPALVLGFLLAALVTLVATPIVRGFARRVGMVDRPEARRVNKEAVARGGGVAVAIGFIGVSAAMVLVNAKAGHPFLKEAAYVHANQIEALLGGGALAVAIGLLDDVFQLRARWQLLGQLALGAFALYLGMTFNIVNIPFVGDGGARLPEAVVGLATLVWIVGMINSINFIDGLDGLSSGIALIAAITLGLISIGPDTNQPFVALFCFILAGALAGFLRWNFNPASIFTGTSGIMLVGYSLAVLSILGAAKVAVALLVLGVPIIDTFWIIVRRLASRRSPFAPDRGHIHHRLLDLGLSHRATVLLIYAVCVVLATLSLVLAGTDATYAFLGLAILGGLILLALEQLGGGVGAIEESLSATSYENGNGGAGTPATGPNGEGGK